MCVDSRDSSVRGRSRCPHQSVQGTAGIAPSDGDLQAGPDHAGCEVPVQAPPYSMYVMKKAVVDFGFYD
jgi:hypothetical protein